MTEQDVEIPEAGCFRREHPASGASLLRQPCSWWGGWGIRDWAESAMRMERKGCSRLLCLSLECSALLYPPVCPFSQKFFLNFILAALCLCNWHGTYPSLPSELFKKYFVLGCLSAPMKLLGEESWAAMLRRKPNQGSDLLPSTRLALHWCVIDTQGFPIKTIVRRYAIYPCGKRTVVKDSLYKVSN